MNTSNLTEARQAAQYCFEFLRAALAEASAVEALVLLPMLTEANKLESAISAMRTAVAEVNEARD